MDDYWYRKAHHWFMKGFLQAGMARAKYTKIFDIRYLGQLPVSVSVSPTMKD
jgi:hypothetical protein